MRKRFNTEHLTAIGLDKNERKYKMITKKIKALIPHSMIENKILLLRGKKVMLGRDLAELYGVETKVLNQAVKRNIERFPSDFMFLLTLQEVTNLKSQIVTSSWGGRRKPPRAFTDYGILMLSSVLNSERAIQVNIQIMRTFANLRKLMTEHWDLCKKIEEMERKYDGQFQIIFKTIKQIIQAPQKPKKQIGFHS